MCNCTYCTQYVCSTTSCLQTQPTSYMSPPPPTPPHTPHTHTHTHTPELKLLHYTQDVVGVPLLRLDFGSYRNIALLPISAPYCCRMGAAVGPAGGSLQHEPLGIMQVCICVVWCGVYKHIPFLPPTHSLPSTHTFPPPTHTFPHFHSQRWPCKQHGYVGSWCSPCLQLCGKHYRVAPVQKHNTCCNTSYMQHPPPTTTTALLLLLHHPTQQPHLHVLPRPVAAPPRAIAASRGPPCKEGPPTPRGPTWT